MASKNTETAHVSQHPSSAQADKAQSLATPSAKSTRTTRAAAPETPGDMPPPPKPTPESSVSFSDKASKDVSVNPATGMLNINIPLINIPQNDGLPLNVTVHYRTDGNPAGTLATLGSGWDVFSGLMPSVGKKSPFWGHICNYPVFLLPDGSTHMFYPQAKGCTPSASKSLHYSKDHLKGMLQTYNVNDIKDFPFYKGIVNTPDGTQYTVDHNVQKITSAHSDTVLTYGYTKPDAKDIPNLYVPTSISSNHGVKVTFAHSDQSQQYQTTTMTLGKSVWTFGYDYGHRLSSITRPDGSAWHMTYDSKSHLSTFTTPTGLAYTFTYAVGANNRIYAKTVVTSVKKYGPRVPDETVKYTYNAPQLIKLAYHTNYGQHWPQCGNSRNHYLHCNVIAQVLPVCSKYGRVDYGNSATIQSNDGSVTDKYPGNLRCSSDNQTSVLPGDKPELRQHYPTSYATTITYPDKIVLNTFATGLNASPLIYRCHWQYLGHKFGACSDQIMYKRNPDYYYIQTYSFDAPVNTPTWNKSLPVSQKIEDPKGHVQQTTTDTWGKRTLTANGGMTDAPELLTQTITRGATHNNTYTYDADGFETNHLAYSPHGGRETDTTWYKNSNLWIFSPQNETVFPVTNGVKGAAVNSVVRSYNTTGELTSESDNGVTTTAAYDTTGNLTSQTNTLGQTIRYANYVAGYPQTVTDPKGNVTKSEISPAGLLMQSTDPLGHVTKYTYDTAFRPLTMTPPLDAAITWSYSSYKAPAQLASITKQHGSKKTTTTYNTVGLPDHTVLYNGTTPVNETWFGYDEYGRQSFVSQPSAYNLPSVLGTQTTRDIFGRPLTVTTAVPIHTSTLVAETVNVGWTTGTYTSKTPGIVREAIVDADLVSHHHSNDHHLMVNGVMHDPYNITDPDHYYNYYYRYDFRNLHAKSPGYTISTNGVFGGHMTITLVIEKPN